MRTTDQITADLRQRARNGEDVRQQLISHQALAQLRAELGTFDHGEHPDRANGLKQQIGMHRRLVEEEADDETAADDASPAGEGDDHAPKRPRAAK